VCRHGDNEWQSTDRCVIRMMKPVVSDTRVFFDAVVDGLCPGFVIGARTMLVVVGCHALTSKVCVCVLARDTRVSFV